MKKPLYLLASLALLLAACGGETASSSSPESSGEQTSSSIPTVTVSSSSSEEPTPRETFLKARKATVDLKGYSYKEVLEVSTDTSLPEGYDPTGTREGNVVYSSTSAVKQVASYENSGALFFDGKRYEIVEGDEKRTIDLKEDGTLDSIETSAVEDGRLYSLFAKAVFEYDDEQITAVEEEGNDYVLTTSVSPSSLVEDLVKVLDSPIVRKLIGTNYPELTPSYTLKATLRNGYIGTFDYALSLTVAGQTITLHYGLEFTSYENVAPTIPNVPGASLDEEELQAEVNGLNGTLDAYRALERSGYSYKAVMEVDFPGFSLLGAEASTTVQGEAKRLIEDGTVYFHNRVKMDTNLPEWGSEDYELFRARIADGSVYDAEDTFGWNNEFTKVAAPVAGDDFYFLPSNLAVSQIAYASSSVKDGVTTHAIVLNDEGASDLIKDVEAATRLDQTLESQPSPYGTWTNLTIESSDFAFEVDAFGLKAIHAALEGNFDTTIPGMDDRGEATWSLELDIEVDNDLAADYAIPQEAEDIELE